MRRPLHIWLMFGAVLLVALASFGWLSRAVLRLDDAQRLQLAEAEREEKVRLALWRMDSSLALMMADEDARSPLAYRAFHSPVRAWSADYAEIPAERLLLPSPLLEFPSTNTRLHFEFSPDRLPESPQVPSGRFRDLALLQGIPPGVVAPAAARLETLIRLLKTNGSAGISGLVELARIADAGATDLGIVESSFPSSAPQVVGIGNYGNESPGQQALLNRSEAQARQQAFNNGLVQQRNSYVVRQQGEAVSGGALGKVTAVGRFTPAWIGTELFLVRRVDSSNGRRFQGVWLDWPALQQSLVKGVLDLVPGARLERSHPEFEDARRLAALPLRLDAGSVPATPGSPWTALRLALASAWICLALAAVALAVLLHGILALSERRAEFVSAVTHELRTPLTTFRLYSEMLADGMVPEGEQRQKYLSTLCAEASRLGHLVENVLAYARLERGRDQKRLESLRLSALVDRVLPRLVERASLADMQLLVNVDSTGAAQSVEVDVGVVEQILFNLVDNAAKYGTSESGKGCIHLEVLPERGKFGMLRIRDHGRGISPDVVGRLFEPFHRSAERAAGSAPGVGLGLALCRKLSRSMGGDLRLDGSVRDGAAFLLSLSRART